MRHTQHCKSSVTRTIYDPSGLPAGFESTCPIDGHVNVSLFDAHGPGALDPWPNASHCAHFRGFYSSGDPTLPQALYL